MLTLFYDIVAEGTTYLVEDETFTSLDRARDVAFELAYDLSLNVAIRENFGAACNVIEVVEGDGVATLFELGTV